MHVPSGAHGPSRRRVAGTLGLGLLLPGLSGWSRAAGADRLEVLADAERALARGDALSASEGFERAALMEHAADSEMGIVRAQMQAGEYRRAVGFCAHAAGAHLDAPGAAVLYAWLLRAGGQRAAAEQVITAASARTPFDPLVVAARRAFALPNPVAVPELLVAPHRLAPMAWGDDTVPSSARVVSSGVLLPGGVQAVVPASALSEQPRERPRRLWLRNGLGHTVRAEVDADRHPAAPEDVVVLRTTRSLAAEGILLASREPFAGSPVFVVEYAEPATADPAWPWLRQGFFGPLARDDRPRALDPDLTPGAHGSLVLDAAGRVAGMALRDDAGRPVMSAVSRWPGIETGSPEAATPAPRVAADGAYERALRVALQFIVDTR